MIQDTTKNQPPDNPMDTMLELHRENQRRLEALEKESRESGKGIATILERTACLPDLVERVDSLESDRDKAKGTMKIIAWVCGIQGGGLGTWMLSHVNWAGLFR